MNSDSFFVTDLLAELRAFALAIGYVLYVARRERLFQRILRLRAEAKRLYLDLAIENMKWDGDGRKLAERLSIVRGLIYELEGRYQVLRLERRQSLVRDRSRVDRLRPEPGRAS